MTRRDGTTSGGKREGSRGRGGRSRSVRRLGLESLESRWLPSLTTLFGDAIAVSGAGSVDVQSDAIANDASGNVYVTGSFQGTVDFDPGAGTQALTSAGGRDAFLAKFSKEGSLLWAKSFAGADSASVGQGAAIAVDANGNVSMGGTFTGTVDFDPNAAATALSSTGRNDAFVARYDVNGNLIWVRAGVGIPGAIDTVFALAVDTAGNLAIAGSYQTSLTLGGSSLTGGGAFESFVARLDSAGNVVWLRGSSGTGTSVAQAAGVAFDPSGNVISTGFFSGQVDLDPGGGNATLPNDGSRDAYVLKLDASGNLSWVVPLASQDIDQGGAVATDASGNVYVTGAFSLPADFDPGAGSTILTPGGFQDPFLLALNGSGQFLWARVLALSGFTAGQGTGVGVDASGRVYVSGYFQGTMTLGAGSTLASAGGFDVFLVEYDASGKVLAALAAGGTGFDADFGLTVNASGMVALAGRYSGPATFGSVTLPAQPGKSIFITQFQETDSAGAAPTAPNAPALQAASDTGASNSDRVTNAASLTFDITGAAAGNLVELLRNGVVVASRVGSGAVTDAGPLMSGTYTYSARQTDASARVSAASASTTVTVSIRVPATPAAPQLLAADDSGVAGDRVTNARRPRLVGTAEANALLTLSDAAQTWSTSTTVAGDGTYSVQVPNALAEGGVSLLVRVRDVAGNTSANSSALALTIDATAPAAPGTPTLDPADDTGTIGDGLTSVRQPRLRGTAEPGATVQLLDGSGNVLGATTASGTGAFSIAPTSALVDGVHSLRVRATDAAGNVGASSASLTLTIQGTGPSAPSTPSLVAADDSGTKGDGFTNVRSPRFSGTATPGVTVQLVLAGGNVAGTAVAGSDGLYTVAPTNVLGDGTYVYQARAVDSAGNPSGLSGSVSVTIDATSPTVPASLALFGSDDSGNVGDGLTNIRQPRFTGLAEAGSTVRLINGAGTILGTATAGVGGSFTVSPASPLADGSVSIRVQGVDAAGNVGTPSAAITVTIDATAPAAPGSPALDPADDNGVLGDAATTVNPPRLLGTAEPGATVRLLDAQGNVLATTLASAGGTYGIRPSGALPNGANTLRVVAVDAAGNLGAASASSAITILAVGPSTPSVPVLLPADDSGVKGDAITNVRAPRFTGTATPGITVQLIQSSAVVIGTTTAAADGAYILAPSSPLADGLASLEARTLDAGGNFSGLTSSVSITIQTTPPPTPDAPTLLPADDTGVKGDALTANRRPRFAGTTLPGLTVQLLNASANVIGVATAGADGAFTIAPTAALGDGAVSLRVQVVDAIENASEPSAAWTLTVDATAPQAPGTPSLLPADDTGSPGDALTSARFPRLTGPAEPGALVQLVDANGTVIGSTTATSAGAYTLTPVSALVDGTHSLRVRASDAAGNLGPNSAALTLTIDSASPATPAAPGLDPADDTGTLGDGATTVNPPRFVGVAEAGATVRLLDAGGTVLGTAVAASDGTFGIRPVGGFPIGAKVVRVQAVDAAGNTSASSATFTVTVLAAAPPTPSTPVLLAADDSGAKGDAITNLRTPRFNGTATPGITVRLLGASGAVLGSTTAAADGSYVVAPSSALAEGLVSVQVRAVDGSGNASGPSAATSITIDATPPPTPAAPTLPPADDSGTSGDGLTSTRLPRLVGTTQPGATVQLLNATSSVIATTTAGADGAFTIAPGSALGDGAYAFRVQAIDVAGNVSAPSAALALTIDGSPPAAPAAPTLLAADDSGAKGDGITANRQPRIIGSAANGSTVRLLNASGVVLATATASSADGGFTLAPTTPLAEGSVALRVDATDAAGNLGAPSGALALVIDATAPAAPSTPALDPADDTGTVGDGATTVNPPRLTGTAEPGSTIQLIDGSGNVLVAGTATAAGSYSLRPTSALPIGRTTLRALATDAAGNSGAMSGSFSLTIQNASVATPTKPSVLPADDTGIVGDGRTAVRSPRFVGKAEAGVTVELLSSTGAVIGSTTATVSGDYTVQPTTALPGGNNAVRARARNSSGITSAPSASLDVVVTTTAAVDFDGDGRADLGVYRSATRQWLALPTSGGLINQVFGGANFSEIPVPAAYDGTGRTQLATFRVATAEWVIQTATGTRVQSFGAPNLFDIPVPGDYNGDGRAELAVYRPSTAQWFVLGPTGGALLATFGAPNLFDIPVPGDYDGDGRTEVAVFRPSTSQWFSLTSSGGKLLGTFGAPNLFDIPVPGDYDGLGQTEIAMFRPSTGQWFVLAPSGGRQHAVFGGTNLTDVPLATSIASLRKLNKLGGTKVASTLSVASQTASLSTVSTSPRVAPSVASPARPEATPTTIARLRPRQVIARAARPESAPDHVSVAIEELERDRSAPSAGGALRRWSRARSNA